MTDQRTMDAFRWLIENALEPESTNERGRISFMESMRFPIDRFQNGTGRARSPADWNSCLVAAPSRETQERLKGLQEELAKAMQEDSEGAKERVQQMEKRIEEIASDDRYHLRDLQDRMDRLQREPQDTMRDQEIARLSAQIVEEGKRWTPGREFAVNWRDVRELEPLVEYMTDLATKAGWQKMAPSRRLQLPKNSATAASGQDPLLIALTYDGHFLVDAFTPLFKQLVQQQREDIRGICREYLEFHKNYRGPNANRPNWASNLASKGSPYYFKNRKGVLIHATFVQTLDHNADAAIAAAVAGDEAAATQHIQNMFSVFQQLFCEPSRRGLGLLSTSITFAASDLGFLGGSEQQPTIAVTEKGMSYLKSMHLHRESKPPKKVRDFGMYVYSWWAMTEEDYKRVASEQIYPRFRGSNRTDTREISMKEGDWDDDFGVSKTGGFVTGRPLGKRKLCRRAVAWPDEFAPTPLFKDDEFLVLGVARLPLLDLQKRRFNLRGILGLSPDKQLGVVSRWIQEHKLLMDPNEYGPWHWAIYTGDLPRASAPPTAAEPSPTAAEVTEHMKDLHTWRGRFLNVVHQNDSLKWHTKEDRAEISKVVKAWEQIQVPLNNVLHQNQEARVRYDEVLHDLRNMQRAYEAAVHGGGQQELAALAHGSKKQLAENIDWLFAQVQNAHVEENVTGAQRGGPNA